jgi:acyl-CoA dehydrogenase
MASPHPVIAYTSEASWAMVSHRKQLQTNEMLTNNSFQIEDKFSPYAKETLAKVIQFLEVCQIG